MNNRLLHLLIMLGIGMALGGCSEEFYGLLPGHVDTLIAYPRQEIQQITVIGDASGMAGMETLYLGSENGTRSDILLEYDFSNIGTDNPDYPGSLFDAANIKSVFFTIKKMRPFIPFANSGYSPPLNLYYRLLLLENSFDPADYIVAPGPPRPQGGRNLNQDFNEPNHSNEPRLRLWKDDVADWINNGDRVSMALTADAGSDSGLVGFASLELKNYRELPDMAYGDNHAPTIVIEFMDNSIPNFLIPPVHDTSTFDQVAALPPDMLNIQTGLRSYPVLTFDIPPLPAGSSPYVMYDFGVSSSRIDSMWEGRVLALSRIDSKAIEGISGPVLAEELFASTTSMARLSTDPEVTGDPRLFTGNNYPHWEPAPPSVMHLMLNFPDITVTGIWSYPNSAPLYFTQSTFHAPSASPQLRPVLYILTGPTR